MFILIKKSPGTNNEINLSMANIVSIDTIDTLDKDSVYVTPAGRDNTAAGQMRGFCSNGLEGIKICRFYIVESTLDLINCNVTILIFSF